MFLPDTYKILCWRGKLPGYLQLNIGHKICRHCVNLNPIAEIFIAQSWKIAWIMHLDKKLWCARLDPRQPRAIEVVDNKYKAFVASNAVGLFQCLFAGCLILLCERWHPLWLLEDLVDWEAVIGLTEANVCGRCFEFRTLGVTVEIRWTRLRWGFIKEKKVLKKVNWLFSLVVSLLSYFTF